MFEEEKNAKSFFGGLIAGAVLGGLTGILFAPKSGRELRQDISDKSGELLDDTNRLLDNAKEKASEIISDAKGKAESLLADAKKKVESLTNDAETYILQGTEKIEDGIYKATDAVKSGIDTYKDTRHKFNQKHLKKDNES